MAYVKNTWAKGDIISASELNHMEDGIAAGGSGEFTTYHMIVDGENETVQTDIPGVSNWENFETALINLSAAPSVIYIRADWTDEYGSDPNSLQFSGFVNKGNSPARRVYVSGGDIEFVIGYDDGQFASIVEHYGGAVTRALGIFGFDFAS